METVTLISQLSADARDAAHSVLGMLELVGDEGLTAHQTQYLSTCRHSLDRLLRILQDVTELTRRDQPELTDTGFELHEAASGVAELMAAVAVRKGLRFEFQPEPGEPVRVRGDRARIEDMLVRLIDHAIRLTSHGSVALSYMAARAQDGAWRVEFVVTDGGPGIDEPTGLGLLVVRRLVSQMGGELTVESSVGVGARVRVVLGLECEAVQAAAGLVIPAGGPLNLLVAEDSDDSYLLFEAYMQGHGHRITRARDGLQAVELFKESAYDLVFMDIRMPGLDGYGATRAIREWETRAGNRTTPVIVLSSEENAVQKRTGATVGCSGYLTKPVSRAQLLETVNRYGVPPR